jgi:plasmid stability protein
VRTTIDLPDELYRTLKTRAAIRGVTMRELVRQLVEQGLAGSGSSLVATGRQEEQLPVAIPAGSSPIRVLSDEEIAEIEMEDERERFGGSA